MDKECCQFPFDNFWYWLLAATFVHGLLLMVLLDERTSHKSTTAYSIAYAIGILALICGIAGVAATASTMCFFILAIPSIMVFLVLMPHIRNKELEH